MGELSLFFAPRFPITTLPRQATPRGRHQPYSMRGATVASAKALKSQLEKLSAKIKTRQTELTDLKTKQKDIKSQLAEAKKATQDKAAKAK
jgi:hypothetical protein